MNVVPPKYSVTPLPNALTRCVATSSEATPVPLPIHRMASTPAARARFSTSKRSESNLGPSRWAWESTNIISGDRDLTGSRAVAGALHHAEVGGPRADGLAILVRHHARELVQMREVMRRPGGEKLRERDRAEGRVTPAA